MKQGVHERDLRNEGLALAMEWGKDWLMPIQARLAARHPGLSAAALDELDAVCRSTMRFGHRLVAEFVSAYGPDAPRAGFAAALRAQHPWVDGENVARLHSQGVYYAMK